MLKLATKFIPARPSLEAAHRAGFRNVELWSDAALLEDWHSVARICRDYPFEFVIHFPNRTDLSAETLEHCVRLYRALECRCLVIHQPMFDKYRQPLEAAEPGIGFAIENHRLSPEQFEHWADSNPGLTLDVEHLWLLTLPGAPLSLVLQTVRDFLQRYGSKLRHVHLPGYVPGFDEHRPMYCSREMVFGVMSLLAEIDFQGLVVSETSPEFQNPNELRMDVLLFDTWRSQFALDKR